MALLLIAAGCLLGVIEVESWKGQYNVGVVLNSFNRGYRVFDPCVDAVLHAAGVSVQPGQRGSV